MRGLPILIVCCVCLVSPARSETYVVNPDGTGDFPTIQAAVDACHTGDTILLGNGVFRGEGNRDVRVLVGVSIRSQWLDPTMCIIDCASTPTDPHYGFWICADSGQAELAGLTIRNGNGWGGAITCYYCSPFIHDCVFSECTGDAAGAVHCEDSHSALLERCVFIRNTGTIGGAFGNCFSAAPTLRECTFWGNSAESGGGVYT